MVTAQLQGGGDLRGKLLEMERAASALFLLPIVNGGAQDLRRAEADLAPRGETGMLAAGISVELIKAGNGYAYALIGPQAEQYYGRFQEFGLGTGRSQPVSARVRRRRQAYEASVALQQKVNVGGVIIAKGLSKQEKKRQITLASGGYLQGKRRPNMAAQPFARPAVEARWPAIRQYITDQLRALVLRLVVAA